MKYVENGIRLRCLQPGKCVDVDKMAADVVVQLIDWQLQLTLVNEKRVPEAIISVRIYRGRFLFVTFTIYGTSLGKFKI